MPFVTKERWANRKALYVAGATEVVGGQGRQRSVAWGIPIEKRLVGLPVQSHVPINRGRRLVLGGPGNARLDWYQADDLAPFEETPDELAHLAEFGADISALRLDGPPTKLDVEHDLIVPPGTMFWYQGELTPQDIEDGCRRPAAVVGSYAVFDAADCKIAHIPRPVLVDATGKRFWGTITITGDPATGIWRSRIQFAASLVPQVTFPCTVYGLDTFGYTTIGGSISGGAGDYVQACGPFSPASSGSATAVAWYLTSVNGNYTFGIYDSSGGNPSTLLRDTGGGAGSEGWNDKALDSALSVTSGTDYWPAHNFSLDAGSRRYDEETKSLKYAVSSYVDGTLAASFPSPTTLAGRKYSVYVTYTVGIPTHFDHYFRQRGM